MVPFLSIGPDRAWNPFSPEWPTTKAARAAIDALAHARDKAADAIASAAAENNPLDPLPATAEAIGVPTWGYYVPSALWGLGVLSAVGVVGVVVYKNRKKKARK